MAHGGRREGAGRSNVPLTELAFVANRWKHHLGDPDLTDRRVMRWLRLNMNTDAAETYEDVRHLHQRLSQSTNERRKRVLKSPLNTDLETVQGMFGDGDEVEEATPLPRVMGKAELTNKEIGDIRRRISEAFERKFGRYIDTRTVGRYLSRWNEYETQWAVGDETYEDRTARIERELRADKDLK